MLCHPYFYLHTAACISALPFVIIGLAAMWSLSHDFSINQGCSTAQWAALVPATFIWVEGARQFSTPEKDKIQSADNRQHYQCYGTMAHLWELWNWNYEITAMSSWVREYNLLTSIHKYNCDTYDTEFSSFVKCAFLHFKHNVLDSKHLQERH